MIDDMAVYIANLGKYNEGYLVGAWFTFPIDEEDVKEKIGLNEQYEEYAIHDTDNFPIAIGEYVSIEELNRNSLYLCKSLYFTAFIYVLILHINLYQVVSNYPFVVPCVVPKLFCCSTHCIMVFPLY